MDTKKAHALAKLISTKTGHSVCIEHAVWHYGGGRSKKYFKLVWFIDEVDCDIETFETFNELVKWAGGKWDV